VLICIALFAVLVITGAGVPITEEVITVFAGVLVHRNGGLNFAIAVWLVCYVGIVIADMITVYLGWHFGRAVLHRRWVKRLLHPRRVMWAHHQVQDHGAWMIAASRFIPGMRYPVLLMAGMMHLPRWKFLTADCLAAVVTVSLQIFIGWWLARVATNFDDVMKREGPITLALAGVGVVLVIGYFVIRRLRGRGAAGGADHESKRRAHFFMRHLRRRRKA
jgi:membrane protein DedA with SNARE-associated domain